MGYFTSYRSSRDKVAYTLILALLFMLILPLHAHIPHKVTNTSLLQGDIEYVGEAVTHLALTDLTTTYLDSITEVDLGSELLHKKVPTLDLPAILLIVILLWVASRPAVTHDRFSRSTPLPLYPRGVCPPSRAPPLQ